MEDVYPSGQLTNIRSSDGDPEPDGALKVVVRKKILHYRQLYLDRPEPIAFMPVAVTGGIWSISFSSCCLFR